MTPLTTLGRVACLLGVILATATTASFFGYLACAKSALHDLRYLQERHGIVDDDLLGDAWAARHPMTAFAFDVWMLVAILGPAVTVILVYVLVTR